MLYFTVSLSLNMKRCLYIIFPYLSASQLNPLKTRMCHVNFTGPGTLELKEWRGLYAIVVIG